MLSSEERRDLAGLIQRRFPLRRKLEITQVQTITHGWETDILSIGTAYEVDGRSYEQQFILRPVQGPEAGFRAAKEAGVMILARELGIPIPRVELHVSAQSPLQNPFILMEKLAGLRLHELLARAGCDELRAHTDRMASILVDIHQLPVDEFEPVLASAAIQPEGYLRAELSRLRSRVRRFALQGFDPLLDRLEEESSAVRVERISLLHNDYHPQNIFIDQAAQHMTIFDWSFAEFGDYRMDLAWSALLFGLMTQARHRKSLLQAYETALGSPVESFEFFEILKFTARMITIASWLNPSVRIPVKKITREAIRGEYKIHVTNVYERLLEITGVPIPIFESL